MAKKWFVGGDDVLQRWQVVKEQEDSSKCGLHYVMEGELVKIFDDKGKAQKTADRLNR